MRNQSILFLLILALIAIVAAIAFPYLSTPETPPGTWLTAPLNTIREEGRITAVAYPWADLSWQQRRGLLYTYRRPGLHVVLENGRYQNGLMIWDVPTHMSQPDTEDSWSVDFYWPDSKGDFPTNARPGTSRNP